MVGTNPDIARKGVGRITLDVEELPAITDPKEAFQKAWIIGAPRTFALGDVDAAWQGCDLVVEGSCEIGGQEHVYLETQRSRAIPLEGKFLKDILINAKSERCAAARCRCIGHTHTQR